MPRLNIAKALKRAGISRKQFAVNLGMEYKNVWRLFRREHDPRFTDLIRYAKAAGCKVHDLIEG